MKMIVIGSSWGGLEPTKVILDDLPVDFDAAVLIVRHSTPGGPMLLDTILASHCEMPVLEVHDHMPIKAGHVYVTPPGITVLVEQNTVGVRWFTLETAQPGSRGGRPSIDQSLVSAADCFGSDCIGVVLSGYLSDGAQGAIRLDRVDGTMIVQSPGDAAEPSMPLSVIRRDSPDFIVPDVNIGPILRQLVLGDSDTAANLA